MTTIRATLKRGNQVVDVSKPIPLDAAGLNLVLDVSPGVELEHAELRVEAPNDTLDVAIQPAIATSFGPLDSTKTVDWISADWGTRRPITSVDVRSAATKGRLKVAEGGPWFPPLPFEFIKLGEAVRLSGVTGTRLLVEAINDAKEKIATTFSSITVKVAARPPDFMASIESEAPFFHHPLLLNPGQVLVLRDELTSALRDVWPANLAGGKINLKLRSSADSRLQSVRMSLAAASVVRAYAGGAETVTLSIATGDSASAFIAEPPPGTLESLAFTVQAQPRPESIPLLPKPESKLLVAHLVGPVFRAAQGFSTPDANAVLTGVDLFLQPLSPSLKAKLAIHPDNFGRPADAPFDKAIAEIAIDMVGEPPWSAHWVSFDLPIPVPVGEQLFWVVLDIAGGEALWLLGDAPAADPKTETAPRGSLYQSISDRVWCEREPPPSYIANMPTPAAHARPRFFAQTPPPAPTVTVQWGSTLLSAPIGEAGRVQFDATALATLTRPTSGDKRIQIIVGSAVASTVTLSALQMRIPWSVEVP